MSGLNFTEQSKYHLFGTGQGRFATHQERRMYGKQIPALLPVLAKPFVSFELLRQALEVWTGGNCEDGHKPKEYYLSHAVLVGDASEGISTREQEELARHTQYIMNPNVSFGDGIKLQNAIDTLRLAIRMRGKMDKLSPDANWGILLPGHLWFSDGTFAELDIDSGTGIGLQGNLWLPPSWNEVRSDQVTDSSHAQAKRVYHSFMQIRPPCSTKIYTSELHFMAK